jgi:hypothetical protein
MGRKTATYPPPGEALDGRDQGKLFLITEMSATQGEEWAMRAMLALMQSDVDVPEDFLELGMAALAQMGLRSLSKIKWELAKPLMQELMDCIQIIPDPHKTHVVRPLIESDIEEIVTRATLKWEVLNLHVDFSQAADLSKSLRGVAKAAKPGQVTKTSLK